MNRPASSASARRAARRTTAILALSLAALVSGAASASAAPPVTAIGPVTEVLGGSAHVSGQLNPGGSAYYTFEYSTDELNWSGFNYEGSAEGEGPREVSTDLHGLKGSTKYFVRLAAVGETEVSSPAPNAEFETLAVDPPTVISVDDASDVISTVATFSGSVERPTPANPDPAFDPNCTFEYITDAQYDANVAGAEPLFAGAGQTPCADNPVTPLDPPEVEAAITGLTPETTYHLRLLASNAGGSDSKEATNTFSTQALAAPVVSIDPVTTFTATTAHFSGQIDAAGLDPESAASWHFQCTPDCPGLSGGSVPADNSSHDVEADATGLEPNTAYQVELVAANAGGSESSGASFQTVAVGPAVRTFPAFALGGGTKALVGGTVNPKNSATSYWVEYGPTSAGPATYPSKAPLPLPPGASAGSGGEPVFVTEELEGLTPATSYHYRLVAENPVGEVQGADVVFGTVPPPAPPASCPNAKLRAETSSAALPECRAYELATPADKNGGDANGGMTSSADGNRLGYYSFVGFGNAHANSTVNTYMAQRSSSGWLTQSLEPPYVSTGLPGTAGGFTIGDFSSDISTAVSFNRSGPEATVQNIFRSSDDGSTSWVTAPAPAGSAIANKYYVGRSADASHIVFQSPQNFNNENPGEGEMIWEWVNGQVRLVGGGTVGTGINASTTSATGFVGTLPEPTVVSADGRRIFFAGGSQDLLVREDGTVTRTVSLSQRSGSVGESLPEPVFYAGAAVDGSRAYFVSEGQFTDDAPPGGGYYSFDFETDVLHYVTQGTRSLISDDGKRVYFLSPEQLVAGQGVTGASNLYTVDSEGKEVAFVATLDPNDEVGPNPTGVVSASVKASPDGSRFAFLSTARLTAFDNAGHREVYLYDLDKGSLRCVSCAPDGQVTSGDASLTNVDPDFGTPYPGRPRGLTVDSRVIFQSTYALLPEDVNGQRDVYQYDDGRLMLISTGTSKYDSEVADNSSDGRDIFIVTRDSLVGQDIDGGSKDIYDARVEGGFPAPVEAEACEGESCQGKPGTPPAFASPATAALSGKGNPPGRKACRKKSKKQRARCGSKAKKHHPKKYNGKKHPKKSSKSGRGK